MSHRGDRVASLPEAPPPERAFGVEVVDLAPRWSPDEWLAVTRGPVGRPEEARAWLVRADGSGARPFAVHAVEARWGP